MKLDEYQEKAARTINTKLPFRDNLATLALGLSGEAGEVADLVKKFLGQGHELDRMKLSEEAGDLLWYVASILEIMGIPLAVAAQWNIEKLEKRYPDGFSEERSRNRVKEKDNGK